MKRPGRKFSSKRKISSKAPEVDEDAEVALLKQRYVELAESHPSGSQHSSSVEVRFRDMPLSERTRRGLSDESMEVATDIQAAAIAHALQGRDVLGAAKTGSGKTLAFIVPLLEKLYLERWSSDDGLAALIISPTRELAVQLFEVLRRIGKYHQFSAGLVTGGTKEFDVEQLQVVEMNILVATPGRLLQHLEVTPGFDASQLQMLVLDEADRILDMGFREQLDGIMQYLPPRQTMLFSATQTKSVKDLARLSLRSPEYLAVHAEHAEATPSTLAQSYIVCPLEHKLDTLYSFLKTHLKAKIIMFFSTCSQARFVFELFKSMQPGITLCTLHGKVKQERRTLIYMDFIQRSSACLIATDIAARGLDFPHVDWVVQADAPEDSAMYIHRVGRTARYNANGRALALLMPCEESAVVGALSSASIQVKKQSANKNQVLSVSGKAATLLVSRPECRDLAKKAFTGYLKSLLLLPDRRIALEDLDLDGFSKSLGLAFTPLVPKVSSAGTEGRAENREVKNVNRKLDKLKKQIQEAKEDKKRARAEGAGEPTKAARHEDDDDLLVVKKVHNWEEEEEEEEEVAASATTAVKRKKLKIGVDGKAKLKGDAAPRRVVYGDDDEVVPPFSFKTAMRAEGAAVDEKRISSYLSHIKGKVDGGRDADGDRERERIRKKHKDQRLEMKAPREQGVADEGTRSSSDSEAFSGSESDGASDDSDDDSGPVVASASLRKQEELALRLLSTRRR